MKTKNNIIKIYEYDHFYKQWEDQKHGLFFLLLNEEIEKWMKENTTDNYDINYDDYIADEHCGMLIIEFTNEEDAVAFKLRWI